MAQRDIVDKIQESHDAPQSNIVAITELLGYAGMFLFYMGLFAMFSEDPITKINGIFFFIIAVIIMAVTTFAPTLATAYHVVGKKYVINFVFYGTKMVRRDMECIRDPLVIAMLDDEDKLVLLTEEDDDVKDLMAQLGTEFLSDSDVDKKIKEAIAARINTERENRLEGLKSTRILNEIFDVIKWLALYMMMKGKSIRMPRRGFQRHNTGG